MIKGIRKYADIYIRYDQEENSVENILRKQNIESGEGGGYLESCGPSSLATLMEGMCYIDYDRIPHTPTQARIQLDDFICIYMNDPRQEFDAGSDGNMMCNRVIKNYVRVAKELFNCDGEYVRDLTYTRLRDELSVGNGVLICLKEPGHFRAAIAYDFKTEEVICHDSWGGNKMNKNGGILERMDEFDFNNVMSYACVFKK